jgi:hypothetical protein
MQQPPNPYPQFPQRQWQQPPHNPPPHRYRGWVLIALLVGYLSSLFFFIIEIAATNSVSNNTASSSIGILGTIATLLILIVQGFFLALDGRNYFSLFGRIQWRRLRGWQRVGLGIVFLSMFVMPALYLAFATQLFLQLRQQTLGNMLRGGWVSYRAKSRSAQIGIALVTSFVLLTFVGLTGVFAVIDRENVLTLTQLTPTTAPILAPEATNTPTQSVALLSPTDTPTAEPQPTATPRPKIVPTHAPVPTQPPVHPTPTKPACQAVNNNPWCYNFSPGSLIYVPPSGFCNYFNCIPTFYGSDDPGDGYIAECNDGAYSQSGGESGACSYHGGVMRPLYSH